MRDFDKDREDFRTKFKMKMERHRNGHIWTGVLLLLIGSVALMKSYVPNFPAWLFSWQTLLIVLGLFIGVRHRFHGGAWFILILIGGAFLANDYFLHGDLRKHLWPLILILLGVFFIFGSHHRKNRCFEKKNKDPQNLEPFVSVTAGVEVPPGKEKYSEDNFVDTTSIFGGAKKNILSKDFKGGDVVNVFGGTELNLTQADINGTAVLELTTIFGGTKLIVPSNWSVKSEAVTIFGGIEDKRQLPQVSNHPEKVLLLRGTVIFGGIDIKSF
jgi:predicted membrane protein